VKPYLTGLPQQIQEAWQIGKRYARKDPRRKITNVLFCGLGGSAIGGDILRSLAFEQGRHSFVVCRSNELANWLHSKSLVILSSYSGNTQEVLDAFGIAMRRKANIIIVTSGGKLERLARRRGVPCLKVPSGLPPRCAIGYLTFSLIPLLKKYQLLKVSDEDVRDVFRTLRRFKPSEAKKIARWLKGKTVRLYGSSGILEAVLLRWKAQFAENAKTIISHQLIPEMFHNEIEGWKYPRHIVTNSIAIFFKDRADVPGLKRKIQAAHRHLRREGGKVLEVTSSGKRPLARIFSLIYLGDWVSYELAQLYHVDPLAIPVITALKKI